MKLDNIKHGVERLNSLVDGWQTNGEIPRIERDMALEELRRLYDQLLDVDLAARPEVVAVAPAVVVADNEPVAVVATDSIEVQEPEEAAEPSVEDDDDVLDIDALLGLSSTVATVAAATVVTTANAAEGVAAESIAATEAVAPVAETPVETPEVEEPVIELAEDEVSIEENGAAPAAPTTGELFAMEDIPVVKSGGRKMLSLYNTSGMAAAATVAAANNMGASKPAAEEQPKCLADVLGAEKRVLGDKISADDAPTAPFNRISDLRKAIGINDKFLMIKDLFGGNAAQYEATIDTLNEFDDLDDCMIYIAENFSWNPDSEGAKLLVSLIERKLA